MNRIDGFLDRITMYRLVLYYLVVAIVVAMVLGGLHVLPYSATDIALSTVFLLAVSILVNELFSRALRVPSMPESVYITALILALIIEPTHPTQHIGFLVWAATWAMASKYVIAFRRKHVFNPAAVAVLITSLVLGQSASWWVGSPAMLPVIAVGGLLVVRKIQRVDMVWAYFTTVLVTVLAFGIFSRVDLISAVGELLLRSPLVFLGFVMLTEPATTPPTRKTQMAYGALVGLLFTPYVHIGSVYFAPEAALLIGNMFVYLVSYRAKLQLSLRAKEEMAPGTWRFRFQPDRHMDFTPGQYLEMTLPHDRSDNRGSRRYFTIASSPTEDELEIGVKFYRRPSTFKKALQELDGEGQLLAGQLSGDFTLPKDPTKKLAFIAGGIGITPFRSILKYLVDTGERRPIVLLYTVRVPEDVVYGDVLEEARETLGIDTVYVATEGQAPLGAWNWRSGFLTESSLREEIPDYPERTFYVSGPQSMVSGFTRLLADLGVTSDRVKTDFFPGLVA